MNNKLEDSNLYGFGGRLSEDFPSQVIIDVTEVCNLGCIHCPHPVFKQSEYYSAKYLDNDLNEKVVNEVKEYGKGHTQYIRYTSEGEPLIHPNAYNMIQYAVENSGVFVSLTTNGTIMNEKRTHKLLDAGVHMIDISIDAFEEETYSKIRVNGDLKITRRNVLNLIDWAKKYGNTKIVVSYIEQPENINETSKFKEFWETNGADYVIIRRLHSAAGAVDNIAKIMREENKKIDRYPCVYPWERIVLNPRGYLSFCPADWTHGSTIIDYRNTTINETWNSEFYESLRKAHLCNKFDKHGFCGQCPDWKQTRWPKDGRGYADLIGELKQD